MATYSNAALLLDRDTYPVWETYPLPGDDFYQMYPVWDTFLTLTFKLKRGKIVRKGEAIKETSKRIIDLETFDRRILKFTD